VTGALVDRPAAMVTVAATIHRFRTIIRASVKATR
jgi:hypothetical protein